MLVEKFGGKPVQAVIEHVRDGSTLRAFLLPDMYHVTVMLSGVRAPTVRLGADGECRLQTGVAPAALLGLKRERANLPKY